MGVMTRLLAVVYTNFTEKSLDTGVLKCFQE